MKYSIKCEKRRLILGLYERLYNSTDISMIIDNTNEVLNKMLNGMLCCCHGRFHTMFVVDTVEHILKSLSYDSKTVEFGKIAALLHDIGNIAGRWNHARKSAVLAGVFLDGLVELLPSEKDTIIQAINDHSDGENIMSAIGAALLIADKVDISKRRCLTEEAIDNWHRNILQIDDVVINISDGDITIDYITTESFSKEILVNGYKKGFNLPINAAKYLDCSCHFQFNGVEERFE